MSEQPQNFLTKKDKDSDYYMKKKRKNALEYERLIQKKKSRNRHSTSLKSHNKRRFKNFCLCTKTSNFR